MYTFCTVKVVDVNGNKKNTKGLEKVIRRIGRRIMKKATRRLVDMNRERERETQRERERVRGGERERETDKDTERERE